MSTEGRQNFQIFQGFNNSVLKPNNEEEISQIIKECYKKTIIQNIIKVIFISIDLP